MRYNSTSQWRRGRGEGEGGHLPIVVVKVVVTSVQHAANKLTYNSASYISYSYSSHSAAMLFMISLQLGAHCASWLIVCAFALSLAKILMACVGFITPNFLANKHAPNEPQTQHDIEGGQGKREGRRE